MKKRIVIPLLIFVLSCWGCYYDNEEELYGLNCDTANVSYSVTIRGIISSYGCLSCHSTGVASGGFTLETYADVKAKVTDGRLFGAISHSPGFSPMPQNADKMNRCDLNKVKAWIDAGAPNN